jgi:hypothetical protein
VTTSRRVSAWTAPAGLALAALALIGSGWRVALPVLAALVLVAAGDRLLPRGPAAALDGLAGVVAFGGGLIAHAPTAILGGALLLFAAVIRGWGVNRERTRGRAWALRALTAVGLVLAGLLLVYPTLLTIGYLAKPRAAIREDALGLPHTRVRFAAGDGVALDGWWVRGRGARRRAAIVVVHGGGGDREGAVRHARLLARHGYAVLLYDARGRGRSGGHANAFGWEWDRDVRGAVDEARRRGARRVGLLGLSTGAEAVVTEAAGDPRVRAVVADGLQGRIAADAARLSFGDRSQIEPAFVVTGTEIRAVRGETPPPPLHGLVRRLAATRPLLLIGTLAYERHLQAAAAKGTRTERWELPDTQHTAGIVTHPRAYAARVLGLFDRALGPT